MDWNCERDHTMKGWEMALEEEMRRLFMKILLVTMRISLAGRSEIIIMPL